MKIDVERYTVPKADWAKCSNMLCPNAFDEGAFAIVTVGDGPIVGGHRKMRLFLCIPCADALTAEAGR